MNEEVRSNTIKFLRSLKDYKIFDKEKDKVIDNLNYAYYHITKRDEKVRQVSKLNDILYLLDLPFVIHPKRTNSKRYWIIEEIEE